MCNIGLNLQDANAASCTAPAVPEPHDALQGYFSKQEVVHPAEGEPATGDPARTRLSNRGQEKLVRIRPGIVDLRPKAVPKPDETTPKMPGAVPTNRHAPIPIDFGPVSTCFDHDPKLSNCEIAQPSGSFQESPGGPFWNAEEARHDGSNDPRATRHTGYGHLRN